MAEIKGLDGAREPGRGAVNGLLAGLLVFFTVLLPLVFFAHELAPTTQLGGIGNAGAAAVTRSFAKWYIPALAGTWMLESLLLLITANARRHGAGLLAVGLSLVVAAVVCVGLGHAGALLVPHMAADWQRALVDVTEVFKDYAEIYAALLTVAAAALISARACIAELRRAGDE